MSKTTTPTDALGTFDGRQVVTTSVQITNAGDGLSAALTIDPQLMHHGQIVTIVLECEVTKVGFVPVKDTDVLNRVHTMRAGIATLVDPQLVRSVLAAQRKKIDEARGIQTIPGIDGPIDPENDIPDLT